MSTIKILNDHGLLECELEEKDFIFSPSLEVYMGSIAYGVSSEKSDYDIHAVTTPPLEYMFPNMYGYIHGFSKNFPQFENFTQHNIMLNNKEYDVCVYSLCKLIRLAINGNPNILDFLWVPEFCILTMDDSGKLLREKRKLFLSKSAYSPFVGFATSQFYKLKTSNRKELVKEFGYDIKYAYHCLRILLQAKQIYTVGDMDLLANSDILKEVKYGKYDYDSFCELFIDTKNDVISVYEKCEFLPDTVSEYDAKNLLLDCLKAKHGVVIL